MQDWIHTQQTSQASLMMNERGGWQEIAKTALGYEGNPS